MRRPDPIERIKHVAATSAALIFRGWWHQVVGAEVADDVAVLFVVVGQIADQNRGARLGTSRCVTRCCRRPNHLDGVRIGEGVVDWREPNAWFERD